MKKLILSAIVILSFSAVSFGVPTVAPTNTATATVTANIIQPITITNNSALGFGNIATGVAGTVLLNPANASRTASSGVVLPPTQTGSVTAADFTVSGEGGTAYTLTLPAQTNITQGGNNISINAFTSTLTSLSGGILGGTGGTIGTQDVKVGATLNILSTQVPGSYTGTFSVTVNYN